MKRIAIVLNTSWNIYNFRMNLANFLKNNGYEVIFIAPYDAVYSPKIASQFSTYFITMDSKGVNPFTDFKTFYDYFKLYREIKPHMVLNFTIKPNIYSTLAAKLLGIKAINNISGLGTLFIQPSFATTIAKVLYKLTLSFTCKVFFQNHEDYKFFKEMKLVDVKKCSVIPGSGVDIQKFKPQNTYNFDETIRFLLIARMLKDKGVCEFVEAAKILKQCYTKTEFLLLGHMGIENRSAIEPEELKQWVEDGLVTYMGATDDVVSIIETVDCVVLPSYREGAPRSLLEACAMEKPIVTTNVVGCKHLVEEGVNGFLCEAKNAHDLAKQLEKIINLSHDERKKMGENARQKIIKEYDEIIVLHAYKDAIQEAFN